MKYLAFLLLGVTILFSCGNNDKENQTAVHRADSLAYKVGVTPTEGSLPLYVAEHLGLLDSLHADVRLKRYHALSECRIALQSSLVEAAVIDSSLMQTINAKYGEALVDGTPIGSFDYHFLTAKKARVRRISQLSDKVIAADSHGVSHDIAALAIDSMLKRKNHVFIIQAEDLRVRTQMLITGNVDAAILPQPFASQAVEEGAFEVSDIRVKGKKPLLNTTAVLAYRTATVKDSRRRKQRAALLEAVAVANDSIQKYGKEHYFPLLKK